MSAPANWVAPVYRLTRAQQDEALDALRREAGLAGDVRTVDMVDVALGGMWDDTARERARTRCLAIIADAQAQEGT